MFLMIFCSFSSKKAVFLILILQQKRIIVDIFVKHLGWFLQFDINPLKKKVLTFIN